MVNRDGNNTFDQKTVPTVSVEADPHNPKGKRRYGRNHPVTVDVQNGIRIRRAVGWKRRVNEVARKTAIHERRRQAFQLKYGGYDNIAIGLFLHADPSVNSRSTAQNPRSVVGGYGWQNYRNGKSPLLDESLRTAVARDITEGLAQAAMYETRSRDEYIQLECATLNAAQAALWPDVLAGKGMAIERLVKISERKSKLLGLDAPVRTESKVDQTISVQGVQPEVNLEYAEKMFAALAEAGAVVEIPHRMLALGDPDAPVDAEVVPNP